MREQLERRVADQVRRGLVAGDEQQDQHREQLARTTSREPSSSACDEPGQEVVLRRAPAILDQAHEVRLELGRGCAAAPPTISGDGGAKKTEPSGATSASDHALNCARSSAGTPIISAITITGQRIGERLDQVDLAARERVVEQLVRDLLDARRELADALRRERLAHEAAQARVLAAGP